MAGKAVLIHRRVSYTPQVISAATARLYANLPYNPLPPPRMSKNPSTPLEAISAYEWKYPSCRFFDNSLFLKSVPLWGGRRRHSLCSVST